MVSFMGEGFVEWLVDGETFMVIDVGQYWKKDPWSLDCDWFVVDGPYSSLDFKTTTACVWFQANHPKSGG